MREFFINDEVMTKLEAKNHNIPPLARSIALMSSIIKLLKAQGMRFEPSPESLFFDEKPIGKNGYYHDDAKMAHVYWQDSRPQPAIQDVPTDKE